MRSDDRKLIFISHARPDDDELTHWLCGRLAARGYRVWADLEQLLGGEPTWEEIENAIRNDTVRFICIISNTSVERKAVKDEIAEACSVMQKISDKNFIIPIKSDNFPWNDFPIQLKQLNGVDFSDDWPEGLFKLLKSLDRDNIPKDDGDPEISKIISFLVASKEAIRSHPEPSFRNWLSIEKIPQYIHYYHTSLSSSDLLTSHKQIVAPHAIRDRLILSFDGIEEISKSLSDQVDLELRYSLSVNDFLEGRPVGAPKTGWQQAHNYLSDILRQSIENYFRSKGLIQFDTRWYVPKNWRDKNKAKFTDLYGNERKRILVGKAKDLTWHFSVTTRVLSSEPRGIIIVPHVLFSPDGINPFEDQKQLRRRYCKLWWNDKWRDLLLAFLSEILGNDNNTAEIAVGGENAVTISTRLQKIELPVSYSEETAHLRDELDVKEDDYDLESDQDGYIDEDVE